jgi:hypothetical protein
MAITTARRETEIMRAILDYLAICPGVVAYRQNVGVVSTEHKGKRHFVRYGFPGMSDIGGWVDNCRYPAKGYGVIECSGAGMYHVPRQLAIEVKRPGEKPSALQATYLDLVNKAGGLGFVATCVDDVIRALGRH